MGKLRVVLLGAALCFGCESDPSQDPSDTLEYDEEQDPTAEGLLELGSFGTDRIFAAYGPDSIEEMEMGLQGGFHIFVDGRLRPADAPPEVVIEMTVVHSDDDSLVTEIKHQRVPDIEDPDGYPTLPEMIVFIPDPDVTANRPVRLTAHAFTPDGTLLDTAEAELFIDFN